MTQMGVTAVAAGDGGGYGLTLSVMHPDGTATTYAWHLPWNPLTQITGVCGDPQMTILTTADGVTVINAAAEQNCIVIEEEPG